MKPDARQYSPDAATVRRLVKSTGLSTDECAERLGVSKRALNHWQSGAKDCPYSIHYCLTMLGMNNDA